MAGPPEPLGNNDELGEWEYSEEDQMNTSWDDSYWDDTSRWNYEPEYSALDLLPAIQDGGCGWDVVSVLVRRRRNARCHVCHEQRCVHVPRRLGIC